MFYVKLENIPFQMRRLLLLIELEKLGIKEVYYNEGGWSDYNAHTVCPHLVFKDEGDAIMYALTYGASVLTELPTFDMKDI